jgi:hypothetical protein
MDLTKGLIASGVTIGLIGYAQKGNITGPFPTDRNEQDEWRRRNIQPWSIKVGDRWWGYHNWGPLAFPIIGAAAFSKRGHATEGEASRFIQYFMGYLTDTTMLQGVKGLMNATMDPDSYAQQFITQTISGFVPYGGALRLIDRIADPVRRDTRATPHKPTKDPLQGLWNAVTEGTEAAWKNVQAGTPGMSQRMPAMPDTFGRPLKKPQEGLENLSPLRVTRERGDHIDNELKRLDLSLTKADDKLLINDEKVKMTPAENREYQTWRGQALHAQLEWLIGTPAYQRASDQHKTDLVEKHRTFVNGEINEIYRYVLAHNRDEKYHQKHRHGLGMPRLNLSMRPHMNTALGAAGGAAGTEGPEPGDAG